MDYNPSLLYNDYPIAMYNCDEKKLVAVFRSKKVASVYIFNKPARITSSTILRKDVIRPSNNPYGVRITFRTASEEQRNLIKGKDMFVILDERFTEGNNVQRKGSMTLGKSLFQPSKPKYTSYKPDIAKLINEGYTVEEIAQKLDISQHAVMTNSDGNLYLQNHISKFTDEQITKYISLLKKRLKRPQ